MKNLVRSLVLSGVMLASPAHAFFDQIVIGITSVSNNLIDSSENVANNTLETGSTTVLMLSRDIGKMADRIDRMADKIGLMADRIGVMADRIVLTESMMATFAHKLVDTAANIRTQSQIPTAIGVVQPVMNPAALACTEHTLHKQTC